MKRFEVSPTYTSLMNGHPACQMEFMLQVEVITSTQACKTHLVVQIMVSECSKSDGF